MSISRNLVVTIKDDVATLNERIFIYENDKGIDLFFELKEDKYKFENHNLLKNVNEGIGTVTIINPLGVELPQFKSEIIDGKIKFTITSDLTDEITEVGVYKLQFHIGDAKCCEYTIPPIEFTVKERLKGITAAKVDTSKADYCFAAEEIELFTIEGRYIKTTWKSGDFITANKLNKIEEGIKANEDTINNIQLTELPKRATVEQFNAIEREKYDDISISGNELSMSAKGVVKKTIALPREETHAHDNKDTLDKITEEKISSWDSKAEGSHNHDTVYAKKSEIPVVDVDKQYVDAELSKKSPIHEHPYLPNTTKIPTKVSELTNDSGYLTEHQDISGKVDKEVGKGLSTNDFTTAEKEKLKGLNNYTLPTASATVLGGVKVGAGLSVSNGVLSATGGGTADSVEWGNIQNKPSTFPPATHNHSYNDLTEKPVIPTKVSQLQNDSNYASKTDLVNKVDKVKGKSLSTNDLTEELKSNYDSAYAHTQIAHAPSTAQKNSDITLSEIEAKLVGNITTHTHDIYLTEHQDISNLALKSEIVKSYNQLTDKPVIPSIDGLAKETYVDTKVAEIVDSAPETLNTLQELATALGNDPNFATTVARQIGEKAGTEYVNTELGKKVNTEGYVATENSYTTVEKTKLQGIQEGANNYVHPAKHKPSEIAEDNLHRFITDTERQTWNNKSEFTGDYNELTNKPTIPTVSNDLTNTLKTNYDSAYAHSTSLHAPSNAQRNADITKGEIEAKLIGNITTHTHSQYLTQHQSLIDYAKKTEIPNRMSQLQNDASYAKESSIDTKISARLGDIKIKKLTKQEFDGLGSKDPNCLYIVIKTM